MVNLMAVSEAEAEVDSTFTCAWVDCETCSLLTGLAVPTPTLPPVVLVISRSSVDHLISLRIALSCKWLGRDRSLITFHTITNLYQVHSFDGCPRL